MAAEINNNRDYEGECRGIAPLLSDYLESTLSGRQVWLVEKHIAICGDCAQLMHELEATVSLLRSAEQYDTGGGFMSKLHARLDLLEPEMQRSRSPFTVIRDWFEGARETARFRRAPMMAVGFAAAAFALMIAGNTGGHGVGIAIDQPPAPEALSRHVALAAGNPFDDPVAAKVEADIDSSADSKSDPTGSATLF